MKKSLIFWFAAVTCAAWILVGCEQEAKTETNTVTNGAAADIASLQLLLDEPGVNPVYYKGGAVPVGDETLVVPVGKTLVAPEGVTVDDEGVFVVAGNLSLGAGKKIVVTTSGGTVVGSAAVTAEVTGTGAVTGPVTSTLAEATAAFTTESVVLVTGAVSGAALDSTAVPSGKKLYVANTLTLAAAPAPGGSVIPLGTVSVTAATLDISGIVDDTAGNGKLTLTNATLTNSAAAAVTLPTSVTVKAINAGSGAAKLTIADATSLTVSGDLTGDLALTAAVTDVTIDGGNGNIEFSTGTPAFATNPSNFGNTGLTTFKADAGSTEVTLTFAGPVAFEGDFTRTTSGAYIFGGDVTVTSAKALTLGGTDTVTLAKGKSIKVGSDTVLTAGTGADAVLTPVTGAVLTAAAKKLTLGTANLTLTSGTLTVEAGSTLTLDKVLTVAAGAELAATGDVTVTASTGGLTLTGAAATGGAKLSGAGKVALGYGHITGGASGAWQAVGDSTSIAFAVASDTAASITGTGTSPVLAGLANDSAVITLAKGHDNGDGIALTVTNATIDISTNGAVAFPYVDSTAATLVLQGGSGTTGALKLGAGTEDNTNKNLSDGSHTVTISGTSPVIKGATDDAGAVAGLISGGTTVTTNDATITGQTSSNDVTVKAGATLAGSSS